jgi:hypothetical protein
MMGIASPLNKAVLSERGWNPSTKWHGPTLRAKTSKLLSENNGPTANWRPLGGSNPCFQVENLAS